MLAIWASSDGTGAVRGRRVVVTGVGVVGPCGIGQTAYWSGLLGDAPVGVRRVEGLDATPIYGPKEIRRVDRFTQFAAVAAAEALADAGLAPGPADGPPEGGEVPGGEAGGVPERTGRPGGAGAMAADPDRVGVIIGTGVGGLETLEEQARVLVSRGARRVSPFLVPMMMGNRAAADVSMRYGFRGPCETTVTACAAGTHSVANGARLVATGRCDVVVAGSSEAPLSEIGIAGFTNMTALSSSGVSMPFDVKRDGFVIGEGSGVLILEELRHAEARGAPVYAEVLGAGSTADAHHITAPAPDGAGAVECMQQALADAGLSPADVTHINAHGTSTPLNDAAEAEAIAKVFGTPGPAVTSIKGITGHSLGAAGSLEAVAVVLTIHRGLIPPTAGLTELDPAVHLDVVHGAPRKWRPAPALSNSFGFGGHNGTLIFGPLD